MSQTPAIPAAFGNGQAKTNTLYLVLILFVALLVVYAALTIGNIPLPSSWNDIANRSAVRLLSVGITAFFAIAAFTISWADACLLTILVMAFFALLIMAGDYRNAEDELETKRKQQAKQHAIQKLFNDAFPPS